MVSTLSRWLALSALVVTALMMAGCATPPAGIQPGQLQRAEHVAVASLVGDELWLGYTGMTVFENSELRMPIADWELDSKAEAALVKALREAGGKQVSVLSIDRASVAKAYRGERLSSDGSSRWSDERLREPLLRQARQISADVLVIVFPTFNPPVQHRSETLRGASVSAVGTPVRENPTGVAVILAASVLAVDVKTGQLLGERTVWSDPNATLWDGRRPSVKLEPSQWQKGFKSQPSAAQLKTVRDALESLVPASAAIAVRLLDPPPPKSTTPAPNTPR